MKRINFILFIALTMSLLLFTGCEKKKKKLPNLQKHHIDNAFAKIIEGYTSRLYPSDIIKIRFVKDMVKKEQVGKEEKRNIFWLSPHVNGYLSWETSKTLTFKPNNYFEPDKNYIFTLNLSELGKPDYAKLERFQSGIYVSYNSIDNIDGEFIQDDSTHVHYEGKIKFRHSVKKSDLENDFKLYRENRVMQLHWSGNDVGKSFEFKSDSFYHNDKLTKFKIELKKDNVFLTRDLKTDFVLSVLNEMKVQKISLDNDLENPSVKILLSSEIDPQQDINGLVFTNPPLDLKLKKFGKTILASGNFNIGTDYDLIVSGKIKNKFNKTLGENYIRKVKFSDLEPQITFSSDGVFLPSGNNKKITFKTLNLKKVELSIKKVFPSNITQFLQDNKLNSNKKNSDYYYNFERVGVNLKSQVFTIGDTKNKWLQSEFDLSKLLPDGEKGLYILTISYQTKWVLTNFTKKRNIRGYRAYRLYRNNRINKTIILSDMGLTCFKSKGKNEVYAIDVNTLKPIPGAKIKTISYQNQVLETQVTDSKGKAVFSSKKWFYLEGEYKNQRTYLTRDQMKWNLSTFDVDGVSASSLKQNAYIYTDRGVYRPGDEINLSMIFRNKDKTFPDNHPINLELINPKNVTVFSKTIKNGKDGFYVYSFKTDENAPTGKWRMYINAGNSSYHKDIKIETVVPENLKVKIIPELSKMGYQDTENKITIDAKYLFGTPAKNLHASLKCKYIKIKKKFKKYKKFVFDDETKIFKSLIQTPFDGTLDANGKAETDIKLPAFGDVSSEIMAKLDAEVIEKGGRADKQWTTFTYSPYSAFAGIKKDFSYLHVGKNNQFEVILLDEKGNPLIGDKLKVTIYYDKRNWWWEYRRDKSYKMNFKTESSTEIISQTTYTSQEHPITIDFTPPHGGRYLIEVKHDVPNGHSAAVFYYTNWYWNRNSSGGMQNAGLLTLSTDKKLYSADETAYVRFPAPKDSKILISLDKGDQNIFTKLISSSNGDTTQVKIPLTKEMTPNVYCSVSVIQSQKESDNDRPIRMFGIVPISVQDKETIQKIKLTMPDSLRPNQKFTCKIQANEKTQFTIAIVNEGLLSLTHFKTPDPWKAFYKKIRFGISVFDNLNFFLGANKGDIFKTFSVGGDFYSNVIGEMAPDKASLKNKRRFKPVVLFKGPVQTDENGFAKVDFTMPNYIGEVRVMLVSANHGRYAHIEKSVPVKSELMILPTLPRVIAPKDEFSLPVTIFTMNKKVKKVKISLQTEGAISCENKVKEVTFSKPDTKDVSFKIKVMDKLGFAKVKIKAVSGNFVSKNETDINIRAPFPRIFKTYEKLCLNNSFVEFDVPNIGLQGTNELKISTSKQKKINYEKRLAYLIRYPYGCLEQTVSSVFPQLYLSPYIKQTDPDSYKIDDAINTAIHRLNRFLNIGGDFRYWPYYYSDVNEWANLYAGHFLLEAKQAGYFVPQNMFDNWINRTKSKAISENIIEKKDLKKYDHRVYAQIYRMYLLALAKKPVLSKMNLMKETNLSYLNNTEKWLFAATYKLSGMDDIAKEIASKAGSTVLDYYDSRYTFGSTIRDKAIILNCMLILGRDDLETQKLYDYLVKSVEDRNWYSTQTTAFALMAIGNYINHFPENFKENILIAGKVILPNGKKINFSDNKMMKPITLPEITSGKIKVELDKKSETKKAHIVFNWSGVSKNPIQQKENKGISITKTFVDENDVNINPVSIKQGNIFEMVIHVKNNVSNRLDNIALSQILPSGWEVENDRIKDNNAHNKYGVFTDIRDDRVMWFFHLNGYQKRTFKIKLRAITVGSFYLPATKMEAMYDHNFYAIDPGFKVKITKQ